MSFGPYGHGPMIMPFSGDHMDESHYSKEDSHHNLQLSICCEQNGEKIRCLHCRIKNLNILLVSTTIFAKMDRICISQWSVCGPSGAESEG